MATLKYQRTPPGVEATTRVPKWSLEQARHSALSTIIDATLHAVAGIAGLLPRFDLESRGIRVTRDVPYAPHDACRLDVYSPANAAGAPVVLYLHGGGFRVGSKRSHAAVAEPLATAGFIVVLVDYRLAPAHPFPAALDDCAAAFLWVASNIGRYGGDSARIVIAGESAGANLALSLALSATHRFVRPSVRRVFDLAITPRALLPMCGFLHVSDPERFDSIGRRPHPLVRDRLRSISRGYLDGADAEHGLELASPLLVLESELALDRRFPPAFISCGDRDPILDDSVRLARAFEKRSIEHTLRIERGQPHGFQVVVVTKGAATHWAHAVDFLRARLTMDATLVEPVRTFMPSSSARSLHRCRPGACGVGRSAHRRARAARAGCLGHRADR